MELTHEGHRVSSRQVLLLTVVDRHILHNLWSIHAYLWFRDSLKVVEVRRTLKFVLEFFEVFAVIQPLRSAWVQVTQVVEVLLSQTLTFCITQLRPSKGIVNDLKSFPVTLCLKQFVHVLYCCVIAVLVDPSVERDQPDLLQKYFNVAGTVIIDHLRDVVN